LFKKFTTSTGESTSLAERWALLSNICQKNDISLHVKIDDQVGVVVATSKNSKFIEIVLPDYIQEEETFTPKEETEFRHLHAVLNRVFRFAISAARGLKSSGYYSHISAKTKFFTYSRSNDFDMVLKKLLNISELGISRNDHIEIDLTYFTGKSVGNYAYIHLIPRDSGKNEVLVRLFLDFSDSVDQSELDVAFFGNVDQVEKFARSGEFIETSR
jgi:hypothetical protein